MATLNSDVYKNGITSSFLDTSKYYAIFLLSAENVILATSAIIKKTDTDQQYIINNAISWDNENKQVEVTSLDFKKTKSIIETEIEATQYSIATVENISAEHSEAYEQSGEEYYWPDLSGESQEQVITRLVTGSLTTPITVSANNNFRFDKITVQFSEADTI